MGSGQRKIITALYFSPDALRQEIEVNGFKIEEFYSDVAGKPFNSKSTEFAIVARKLDK